MNMAPARILAYGVLGLPLAFAALPVYVHVPRLYAEVGGMDLALLGGILLLTRVCDAAIDPWLGWLADRLPRRKMLAWALLPLLCGFVALLNPPATHAAPWLVAALALTYLGYSAASVAYQSWGAALGEDVALRTRLTAAREGFGLFGVVLAAALPALLAADFGVGVSRLAWVLPPLLLCAAVVTLGGTGAGGRSLPPAGRFGASLLRLFADPAFVRLLLVFVANGVAAALPATLFLFFVADVLVLEAASGPLLAMCAFAGTSLLGPGALWPFALICLLSGLALGADLALPAALAADLGERQGQSGAYFGVWNFVAKLNLALAAGLALPALSLLGYQPGSGHGLSALVGVYALLPLVFKVLAASLLWRWRNYLEIR